MKGAAHAFDEISKMSCSRKKAFLFFYGMINDTAVKILCNLYEQYGVIKRKAVWQREFNKVIFPWLPQRSQTQHYMLPKDKNWDYAGEKPSPVYNEHQGTQQRKICAYCPSKKQRMTHFKYLNC